MPSYRKRTLTEFLPSFRVAPDVKARAIAALLPDENLGALCRVALEAELVRRITVGKTATLSATESPHS
jgi:hypothetical protein